MKPEFHLNVLLVDDDANIGRTLGLSLRDLGCTVISCHSVAEALSHLRRASFDLVLTDFRMEQKTGLDLIIEGKKIAAHSIFVVMTAFASFENAVSVVREGAFDYLPKPFTTGQLAHMLQKVQLFVLLRQENSELKKSKSRGDYFAGLTSAASLRLEEFIRKVAPTDATVLLVGESGTGKSELAHLIHEWSPRATHQFVTVQCTAIAETLMESELFGHQRGAFTGATQDKRGKLELADGGTLFLDEIGDLSLAGQAKLLRFLQERVFERVGGNQEISVDTRVIAATNKNLEEAVRSGKFRDDLYYRLNILESNLVPLRFRKEDLPVLVQRFLKEFERRNPSAPPLQLPEEVTQLLQQYSWPGNVRELRNVLERIQMLSQGRVPKITDLPESVSQPAASTVGPADPILSLQELERRHIQYVLSKESNLEKAAEWLGITTVTLWRKRKEYGLP